MEAEAQAAAEQAEAEGREHPGVPDDKTQRNFTDPDSRIMPGTGGRDFQQSYNCQPVVDHEHQVIVAARATGQVSDKGQAVVMTRETVLNTGETPRELSADAGYYSAQAVAELEALGVDPYIAPERTRHGTRPEPAPRGRIPMKLSAWERMRRKLRTKRGRERYALRMETAEPVFGLLSLRLNYPVSVMIRRNRLGCSMSPGQRPQRNTPDSWDAWKTKQWPGSFLPG